MPPLNIRLIKRRHQQMQIGRQRLHNRDLTHSRTHNRRNQLRRLRIDVQPCWQHRVRKGLEVALDTLSVPGREVLLDASCGTLRLEA